MSVLFLFAGCFGGGSMTTTEAPTLAEPATVDHPVVDFGAVDATCRSSQTIWVSNPNPFSLRVDGFELSGDDRRFDVFGLDDERVPAGGELEFTVQFDGVSGEHDAELTVRWGGVLFDEEGANEVVPPPTRIALSAIGDDAPRWTQRFVQPEPRAGDFLFVYDDPEHMESEMTDHVLPQVGQLFTALGERGADFQVAAVLAREGAGAGRFRGPMITSATASPLDVLTGQLTSTTFFGDQSLPMFETVEDALSPTQLASPPNQGFNRLDAMLSVIFLADRDTGYEDLESEIFRTFLRNQRPEAADVRVHLLGPDEDCSTWSWRADDLEELASLTYGRHLPICDADSTFFRDVAEAGLGLDGAYLLDAQPIGTTCDEVRVDVGGAFIPCTGWEVQDQRLFVRAPYIPAPGAAVAIDYRVEGACDLYQEPMNRD